ncbi:hypothetical protein NLJ89_g12372 [Agrocybe chaxingu]|uniref:Uncharacterized protein n=1 Tax=Agrocybe chaxingu TaxID=84603 RepID=A0A9W8MP52_9AGAR|nr:hypothetical protein NLJ89_g12372 [Agrocybe chaxingu]
MGLNRPWWAEFHSFWRELPNYNPIAVTTSAPGTDHAGEAAAAFGTIHSDDVEDGEADEEKDTIIDWGKSDEEQDMKEKGGNNSDSSEEDEDEDEKPPTAPVKNSDKKPAPKVPTKSKSMPSGGCDTGLAKAHAKQANERANGKGNTKPDKQKTAVDKFQDFCSEESRCLERKREMNHIRKNLFVLGCL